jgi:hypothetical protein
VKQWYVREWVTVAGKEPSTPVRPDAAENRFVFDRQGNVRKPMYSR